MTFGSFRPFVSLGCIAAFVLVLGSAATNAQKAPHLPTVASAKVGDILISRQLATERGLAVDSVV